MEATGVFKGWFGTHWYGMLYRHRDEHDAEAQVLPIIAKGKLVPGMEILDMGCGRGRHAAIFARNGLRATGVDLSPECISAAQGIAPAATFAVFDMRMPFATARFDAVVCLFTSLGYTGDRRDDDLAVAAAATALKPSGLFVLDLMNGERATNGLGAVETHVVGDVHFEVRKSREHGDIVKEIMVVHPGGKEFFKEVVHAWSAEEVKSMVLRAGFRIEDVTDGTCSAPFDPDLSDRIVVWARKPT